MAVYKRVSKRRDGKKQVSYYYKFVIDGITYWKTVKGARTKAQAQRAEIKAKEEVYNGTYYGQQAPTLERFVREKLLPWSKANKRSYESDCWRAEVLVNYFGSKPLDKITPFDIEKFKRDRLSGITKRGLKRSAASVNRDLELLSKVFRMAGIKNNPCRQVSRLREDNHRMRYLTVEEEDRLRPLLLLSPWAHLRPIIIVALNTGLRRGELFSLKKDDVDFNLDVINVLNTKSGKPRQVPIEGETRETLFELCQTSRASEYVFTNYETGTRFVEVRKAFKSACRAAGIENFNFHDLRHTFGTRLADAGVDVVKIKELMGHASITTTMRYMHASEKGKREAIAKLSDYRAQERERCKIVALPPERAGAASSK
jgi:integrase